MAARWIVTVPGVALATLALGLVPAAPAAPAAVPAAAAATTPGDTSGPGDQPDLRSTQTSGGAAKRSAVAAAGTSRGRITFSEYPAGSPLSRYVARGVRFGGDDPFVMFDPAHASQVLTGTPTYYGDVEAEFVTPQGEPRTVGSFSVDVGYINDPGSVQVLSVGADGSVLDRTLIDGHGIVTVTVTRPGIAGFTVSRVGTEIWGFAVDNLVVDGYPDATADRTPTAAEQGGAPNPGELPATCAEEREVNCATGVFTRPWRDVRIAGRGVPLDWGRSYASGPGPLSAGPFGHGWSHTFGSTAERDAEGAVTIRQENGSTVRFEKSGDGYTAPSRVLARLTARGSGWEFVRSADRVRQRFDADGRLVALVAQDGETTTLTYGAGRLVRVTEPAGRTLTFGWTGSRITSVTDPLSRRWLFAYTSGGDLSSAADPLGRRWTFGYDRAHRMTVLVDPRGGRTSIGYDGSGRVTKLTDPARGVTRWSYTGNPASVGGGSTDVLDRRGVRTRYTHEQFLLTSVTLAAGTDRAAVTRYEYDADTLGRTKETDPEGRATTSVFDDAGNLVRRTDLAGRATAYTYDAQGRATSATAPTGRTWTWAYDAHGNLVAATDPAGARTRYGYAQDHPGDLLTVTDPDGRLTRHAYDGRGLLATTTVQPSTGRRDVTGYQHDAAGRVVCEVPGTAYAAGVRCAAGRRVARTTATVYDAADQVLAVTDPAGRVVRYRYDENGNQVRTDGLGGRVTTRTFDGLDRVVAETLAGRTTRTAHDVGLGGSGCTGSVPAAVTCTVSTAPDGARSAEYLDARGDVVGTRSAAAGQVTTTRDRAGLALATADSSGRRSATRYDAAGRPVARSWTGGGTAVPAAAWAYDADGRRVSMTDGSGRTSYAYDPAGRLSKVTDGSGDLVTYGRDAAGNAVSIGYPGGETVRRGFDGANRLTSVSLGGTRVADFAWDADGRPVLTTLANGRAVATVRGKAGNVARVEVGAAGGDAADVVLRYKRDEFGQVTREYAPAELGGTRKYAYDDAGLLTADTGTVLEHDGGGRLTTLPGGVTLAYSGGRLSVSTARGVPTAFAHDGAGRRTAAVAGAAALRLSYDRAGRLELATRLSAAGVERVRVGYDGDGVPVWRQAGTGARRQVVADETGALLTDGERRWVNGPDGLPVAELSGSAIRYLVRDAAGSARLVLDAAGRTVGTATYDAHGRPVRRTGAATPSGWLGAWTDPLTGFLGLGARGWDPATANFTTAPYEVDASLRALATGQAPDVVLDRTLQVSAASRSWLDWNEAPASPPSMISSSVVSRSQMPSP